MRTGMRLELHTGALVSTVEPLLLEIVSTATFRSVMTAEWIIDVASVVTTANWITCAEVGLSLRSTFRLRPLPLDKL